MTDNSPDQPPTKRVKYVARRPTIPALRERFADQCRYDFSQSFDVLVGPEKKRFSVYYNILTKRSRFLQAARSSRWTKDSQRPTDLTDFDPEVFSNYLRLVYTGEIFQPEQLGEDGWAEATETAFNSDLSELIKLYELADKLEDLTSVNLIMDEFLASYQEAWRMFIPSVTTQIYQHTPSNSPLRTVVRDVILFHTNPTFYEDDGGCKQYPVELLLDVLREDAKIKDRNRSNQKTIAELYDVKISDFDKCHYHQHHDGHPKCK